jgi:Predicted integral membrane protein (DUF2269)
MEWLFPWLLLLHVLGAILAFGPVFTFRIIGGMGGKEPQHANFATRVSQMIGDRQVLPLALSMAVTGGGMILVRGIDLTNRAYWWLGLVIVLYAIAVGYSLFVQAKAVARVIELTSSPPPPGATGPPPELLATIARVQRGGMLTGVLIIVIVSLMVLKPQF